MLIFTECIVYVQVINTMTLKYLDVTYKRTHDHSKWAVGDGRRDDMICIGDINRMVESFYLFQLALVLLTGKFRFP